VCQAKSCQRTVLVKKIAVKLHQHSGSMKFAQYFGKRGSSNIWQPSNI